MMVFIAARDFICSTIVAFAGFGAISFLTLVVVVMVVVVVSVVVVVDVVVVVVVVVSS